MDLNQRILKRLLEVIEEDIPGFELLVKEESSLMKTLNVFVKLFNPVFMSDFITTMNTKVYAPRHYIEKRHDRLWRILAHEWWHLREAKRVSSVVQGTLYLLPQLLAPLALLSVLAVWLGPWWLLNLAWLVCAAPLPAWFRAKEELAAYTVSLATDYWSYDAVHELDIEYYAKQFYGPNYYFMWPFKSWVLRHLHSQVQRISEEEYDSVFPFNVIKEIIEEERSAGS